MGQVNLVLLGREYANDGGSSPPAACSPSSRSASAVRRAWSTAPSRASSAAQPRSCRAGLRINAVSLDRGQRRCPATRPTSVACRFRRRTPRWVHAAWKARRPARCTASGKRYFSGRGGRRSRSANCPAAGGPAPPRGTRPAPRHCCAAGRGRRRAASGCPRERCRAGPTNVPVRLQLGAVVLRKLSKSADRGRTACAPR